jgi:hypothetical protein
MDFNQDSQQLSNITSISPSSNTVTFSGSGAIVMPAGPTSSRPTGVAGAFRFNTDTQSNEYFDGTNWSIEVESLATCSDVALTSPSNGQVLQFNGTSWVNSGSSAPSSASGVLNTWTLSSGTRYYADFAHNLNTNNVVFQLYDNSTKALVQADSIVLTTVNSVRVTVIGNTRTLNITVIANGLTIAQPGFDIYTFYANSVDSPNTADFAVNALAPVISDPVNTAINVRSFSNTAEQGIGFTIPIPASASNITFKIRGRAATAPSTATTVTHKLYFRQMPNNAAMGAWSSATSLTAFSIPTNAYYQQNSQTLSLSTLGITPGNSCQFEFTRAASGLAYAWLVNEISVSFS